MSALCQKRTFQSDHIISARGAAASHSFIDPHSSDSRWTMVSQRNFATGVILATASETNGNIFLSPQMEQQRLVVENQKMIECKAHRSGNLRHKDPEPIDPGRYLIYSSLHDKPCVIRGRLFRARCL